MVARSVPILMLSALCLAAPWGVRADVYKWIDEQGVVNYGDAPPQRARGARTLDSGAGTLSVVPGIQQEELDRLRERDTQLRLQRLELEFEELRAREAAQAAAPTEPRFYYGYPDYGYGRTWPRRADTGWPHRPMPPIAKPWPSSLAPMPSSLAPLPSSLSPLPSSLSPLPRSRTPVPGQAPDVVWKR
jgi:Domain of unknown function (DUF4124)